MRVPNWTTIGVFSRWCALAAAVIIPAAWGTETVWDGLSPTGKILIPVAISSVAFDLAIGLYLGRGKRSGEG